jgi:hypothetical protein
MREFLMERFMPSLLHGYHMGLARWEQLADYSAMQTLAVIPAQGVMLL